MGSGSQARLGPKISNDPRLLRRALIDNAYGELPIVSDHIVAIQSLPGIHEIP